MDITKELQQFNITDAAIAELKDRYMGLTIKDLDDKEGFQAVHTARMDIVKRRTSVTKTGKDMRAEANAYNKAVLDEEKRILKLLEPIEVHLDTEETRITNEKARIKREVEEAEEKRIQARVDRLFKLGMTWDGAMYGVLTFRLPHALVKEATDEQFEMFCEKVSDAIKIDLKRLLEEKRLADEEKARLQKIADDQAIERKKLEDEKAALEADKQKILDKMKADLAETKRLADLKEAGERAAAKALQDKEAHDKKEADAKARKAARAPDKEKLSNLGILILKIPLPDMKTEEGQAVLDWAGQEIMKLVKELKKKAEAL